MSPRETAIEERPHGDLPAASSDSQEKSKSLGSSSASKHSPSPPSSKEKTPIKPAAVTPVQQSKPSSEAWTVRKSEQTAATASTEAWRGRQQAATASTGSEQTAATASTEAWADKRSEQAVKGGGRGSVGGEYIAVEDIEETSESVAVLKSTPSKGESESQKSNASFSTPVAKEVNELLLLQSISPIPSPLL